MITGIDIDPVQLITSAAVSTAAEILLRETGKSAVDKLTGMSVEPVAFDPFASEDVRLTIGEVVEVEVKPGEGVAVEVASEAADVDVAVSGEGVAVEVASEAADVGVAVSEEGVAVDVSKDVFFGVRDVVDVVVDPSLSPQVEVLGFGVNELVDPSTITTFALLAALSNFV